MLRTMILYLAADLLWASKIKGTGDSAGLPCRPVRSMEMLEARLADCDVAALVVDLERPDEALAMIDRLRGPQATEAERSIRILAFGPHISKDLLQAARQRGADTVMTRGAFGGHLADTLLQLASRARV
jgi:hypothetical protein